MSAPLRRCAARLLAARHGGARASSIVVRAATTVDVGRQHRRHTATLLTNVRVDHRARTADQQRASCSAAMSDKAYDALADALLEHLTGHLDTLVDVVRDMPDEFDVNCSMGVLTVALGGARGTYVINKQSPNRQMWLSSPVSGPKRYDYVDGDWVYAHDGSRLIQLLNDELNTALGTDRVAFTLP